MYFLTCSCSSPLRIACLPICKLPAQCICLLCNVIVYQLPYLLQFDLLSPSTPPHLPIHHPKSCISAPTFRCRICLLIDIFVWLANSSLFVGVRGQVGSLHYVSYLFVYTALNECYNNNNNYSDNYNDNNNGTNNIRIICLTHFQGIAVAISFSRFQGFTVVSLGGTPPHTSPLHPANTGTTPGVLPTIQPIQYKNSIQFRLQWCSECSIEPYFVYFPFFYSIFNRLSNEWRTLKTIQVNFQRCSREISVGVCDMINRVLNRFGGGGAVALDGNGLW